MDLTPDQVFNELRRIRGRLDTLQPGASERAALEARRDELRRQAAATSNATRSKGTLRIELDHLRTRLADLDAERVEVPAWQRRLTADGRFCLTNPLADAARINAVMDEATAHDRAAILARIAEIEEALDE